jgi:hypothetical protein
MKEKINLVLRRNWRLIKFKLRNFSEVMRQKLARIDRKKAMFLAGDRNADGDCVRVFWNNSGICLFFEGFTSPTKVVRRDGYSSRIYDRNGQVLYDLYKDAKKKSGCLGRYSRRFEKSGSVYRRQRFL